MDSRMRLTFACGVCLGLAVGFAAGHFSFWNHLPRQTALRPLEGDLLGSGGFELPLPQPPEFPAATPSPGGAVVLNDPDLGDEPVHADALVEMSDERDQAAPSAITVANAKPIPSHKALNHQTQQVQSLESEPLDPEVVKMLQEELQGVSEQQREVWADALRGLTPEDATGIIFMWKKFGQPATGHLSSPPPLFSSSHPDPTLRSKPHSLKELLPPAKAKPADALSLIQEHNRANRETCGYLNLIPLQQELPLESSAGHKEYLGYRLDFRSQQLVETGNPSHVVLQQNGFFAVQLSTGEIQYTRVGRLVLDGEQRLCIDLGSRDLPLSPEVKLPAGTYQLTQVEGQLRALVGGQTEPVEVPTLKMAMFFDASRLRSLGGGLYSPTTASGAAQLVPASLNFGVLEYPRPLGEDGENQ